MKNFSVGAVFGVIASIIVQFFMLPDSKKETFSPQQSTLNDAGATNVVPASNSNGAIQGLSEQQLRSIIQEELQTTIAKQLSGFSQEIAKKVVSEAEIVSDAIAENNAAINAPKEAKDSLMYQTVSDIVEFARADGYFTDQSLTELKMHYNELSNAQKFEIDAKLAQLMNSGAMEFDESVFIPSQ